MSFGDVIWYNKYANNVFEFNAEIYSSLFGYVYSFYENLVNMEEHEEHLRIMLKL